MTIFVYHGDNTALSRKALQDALVTDKTAGHDIKYLEGDKLAPRDLESTLATSGLFGAESLVIENLLSRLRSKDKDACLALLAGYSGIKHIFLWDKKEITKPNLAKLGSKVKISLSKVPTQLFTLMESLAPGNAKASLALLHQVVVNTEDIIIFTMLARQVSYLIMIKSATSPKFAPWQIGKLKAQAALWSDAELQSFLSSLLRIDLAVKTGATKLSYLDHLDLLLLDLLG